jgi:hypothetical protein
VTISPSRSGNALFMNSWPSKQSASNQLLSSTSEVYLWPAHCTAALAGAAVSATNVGNPFLSFQNITPEKRRWITELLEKGAASEQLLRCPRRQPCCSDAAIFRNIGSCFRRRIDARRVDLAECTPTNHNSSVRRPQRAETTPGKICFWRPGPARRRA